MKKIDLLYELYKEKLDADGAYKVYKSIITSPDAPMIAEMLSLSQTEWTAFGHGVALEKLAMWRYRGWPNECTLCVKPIVIEKFGWMVDHKCKTTRLRHIKCPSSSSIR